jgi:hypothetical protein
MRQIASYDLSETATSPPLESEMDPETVTVEDSRYCNIEPH